MKVCSGCRVKVWGSPYNKCPRCGGELTEFTLPVPEEVRKRRRKVLKSRLEKLEKEGF